jgi:hypothetical protein
MDGRDVDLARCQVPNVRVELTSPYCEELWSFRGLEV